MFLRRMAWGAACALTLAVATGCHHRGFHHNRIPPEPAFPGYSYPAAGAPGAPQAAGAADSRIPTYTQQPSGRMASGASDPFGNVESLPSPPANMPAAGSNVVGQPDDGPSPY